MKSTAVNSDLVTSFKLAGYLCEAGEDPAIGCATLRELKIRYVVLRYVWANNVDALSDQSCKSLKELLDSNNLTVVAVASNLGNVPAKDLHRVDGRQVDRVFNLAAYFNAPMVRVFVGTKCVDDVDVVVRDWMAMITERCVSANVVPLLEVYNDGCMQRPADLVTLLTKFRRWRLLYDPVQFILKQNQDPFVRYWTLLKQFAGAVDVRDFKIGKGCKPAGFGDTKLKLTVNDAIAQNIWCFLEPGLGRRYGEALTRSDTFKLAVQALISMLS